MIENLSTLNKEWIKYLDDANDSGNFCVRGYISLIQKDSVTDMHGLAVHVKEKLLFARDLYLENSAVSNLCFLLTWLHLVPYFFLLYWWPSSSLCTICDAISSNQFVIFKLLSYCFEEAIGFDVKASFTNRPESRLIRWYNEPGDITKEF